MTPVNALIAYVKQHFPVNRVIALLTVLIFVPLASSVTAWAAKHFPGVPFPSKGAIVTGLAIGGAGAISIGYKFLENWGKHEDRLHALAVKAQELAHELHLAELAAETKKQVAAIEEHLLQFEDATPADAIGGAKVPSPPTPLAPSHPTPAPVPVVPSLGENPPIHSSRNPAAEGR